MLDLQHHGDSEVGPGLIDLAVNVRQGGTPERIRRAVEKSLEQLGDYPNQDEARQAVAARHRRTAEEVLLTAGAAEAFVLLARALRPRHPVVIHPQFTEPERALRAAGHRVDRLVLAPPFRLDPAELPETADLVVLGNPTNPTSVLHPAASIRALLRPGRLVVVDEAFADCVSGEPESVAADRQDGLVVIRSLTKAWALAGLRCGYLLGPPELVATLAAAQPLWPVSTPALAACLACSSDEAVAEIDAWAAGLAGDRAALVSALVTVPGVQVMPDPAASYVLLRHRGDDQVRLRLREAGFAARRGDTFAGLGPDWLRVAVRDRQTSADFAVALAAALRG
ncbi:MAG: Rv2231c family pyridoxal phosphate-dependent protein CobC [Jatrophihabitans sp.]